MWIFNQIVFHNKLKQCVKKWIFNYYLLDKGKWRGQKELQEIYLTSARPQLLSVRVSSSLQLCSLLVREWRAPRVTANRLGEEEFRLQPKTFSLKAAFISCQTPNVISAWNGRSKNAAWRFFLTVNRSIQIWSLVWEKIRAKKTRSAQVF